MKTAALNVRTFLIIIQISASRFYSIFFCDSLIELLSLKFKTLFVLATPNGYPTFHG